jgi:hypothetical protein
MLAPFRQGVVMFAGANMRIAVSRLAVALLAPVPQVQ